MKFRIASCLVLASIAGLAVAPRQAAALGQTSCSSVSLYSNGNVFLTCYQEDGSSAVYQIQKDSGDAASTRNALVLHFMTLKALKPKKAPILRFNYDEATMIVGTVYLDQP